MNLSSIKAAPNVIMGLFIGLGIIIGFWLLSSSLKNLQESQRTVSVKGLSEREVPADQVIWPIVYKEANNDLANLYNSIDAKNNIITSYLIEKGISKNEITFSAPSIVDRSTEMYSPEKAPYRYYATSVITVSSRKVDLVRELIFSITELGKKEIAFVTNEYNYTTEFSYSKLNEIKGGMIEEATKNARKTAQKFADDSESSLGKIKNASQGQIIISNRDAQTPHIKVLRIVSTIEYYLKD